MKKYLCQNLWGVLLATILVSCGKDDKVVPYDPNYMAGNYEGTCVIDYGTKSQTDNSFFAQFVMDSSNGTTLSGLFGDERTRDEDGLGLIGNVQLTNFENHGQATFHMSNIVVKYNELIPKFISKQTEAFVVKSAVLTLACEKEGRFDPSKQEMRFVYKGKLEIEGTQSNQKFSNSISYSFVLKKI